MNFMNGFTNGWFEVVECFLEISSCLKGERWFGFAF